MTISIAFLYMETIMHLPLTVIHIRARKQTTTVSTNRFPSLRLQKSEDRTAQGPRINPPL